MLFIKTLVVGGVVIELTPGSVLVIVGPNNGGKTTVLREIVRSLQTGSYQGNYAVEEVTLEGDDDYDYMIRQIRAVSRVEKSNNTVFVRKIGTGQNMAQMEAHVRAGNLKKLMGDLVHAFCDYASIASRMALCDPTPSPDFATGVEKEHHIHFLFDSECETRVTSAFQDAFSKPITMLRAGAQCSFYFGEDPNLDVGEDRSDTRYIKHQLSYPSMKEQGEGMKSYLATLMICHATRAPIKLIDEPCALLHPPQARTMGKHVLPASDEEQRIISTHSGHLLKGILESDKEKRVQVIRVARDDSDATSAQLLTAEKLQDLWGDPTFRYSNLADALFHDQVILCEDDTDCRFYFAVREAIDETGNKVTTKDVMYAAVGGKGALARAALPLREAGVDVRCIADVDVLRNRAELTNLVLAMGGDYAKVSAQVEVVHRELSKKREVTVKYIAATFARIMSCSNLGQIWSDRLAKSIKPQLKSPDLWSEFKRSGRSVLSDALNEFDEIINYLRPLGIHVVVVGQIESFCKSYAGHSRAWLSQVLDNNNLAMDPCFENARQFVQTFHATKQPAAVNK